MKTIFVLMTFLLSINFAHAEEFDLGNVIGVAIPSLDSNGEILYTKKIESGPSSLDMDTFNSLNNISYEVWAKYERSKSSHQEAVQYLLEGNGPADRGIVEFHQSVQQFLQSSPLEKFSSSYFANSKDVLKSLEKPISPLMRQTLMNLNIVASKHIVYGDINNERNKMIGLIDCLTSIICDDNAAQQAIAKSPAGYVENAKILVLSRILISLQPEGLCENTLNMNWTAHSVEVIYLRSLSYLPTDSSFSNLFTKARNTLAKCYPDGSYGLVAVSARDHQKEIYNAALRNVK